VSDSSRESSQPKKVAGVIEEVLPRKLFRIRTSDGKKLTATIGASARRVSVSFLPGDAVTVAISPYDPTRGRIEAKK
jgi:translation initiation factor IF-1